jgi:molybdopterin biosynthesis enzyme
MARLETIVPGRAIAAGLAGAILTRDLVVAGHRIPKGTRLSTADLDAIAGAPADLDARPVSVLLPDPWEVHEDEAAVRLAEAVSGGRRSVVLRGPAQSRVDLVADVAGVVEVRLAALERLNRLDPLEVFTVFDGQVVAPGDLVASVKIAPHVVHAAILATGEAVARRGGPLVRVRPFRKARFGVLVKERIAGAGRDRFEAAVHARVDGLGGTLLGFTYVCDDPEAVTDALAGLVAPGPGRATIVLTAGSASTDPADTFFAAIAGLGGRVVRHGVPSHPGSMLWLAVVEKTAVVGLPSCGAYSMATAADLLLPRLVAGQPASARTVARLAHGGILDRHQRFRFPAYARDLEAPGG